MLWGFLYEQILFLWVMAVKSEPSGIAWLPFASCCFSSLIVVAKWDIIIRDPPTLYSLLEVKFWVHFSDKSPSTVCGNVIYARIRARIRLLISWHCFAQPDNRKAHKMKMHTALWLNSEMHVKIVFLFIITAGISVLSASRHFPSSTYSFPHTHFFLILACKLIWSLPSRSVKKKIFHNTYLVLTGRLKWDDWCMSM